MENQPVDTINSAPNPSDTPTEHASVPNVPGNQIVGPDAPESQLANASQAATEFPDEPGVGFPYPYPVIPSEPDPTPPA